MTRRLLAYLPCRLSDEGDVLPEFVLPQVLCSPASAQAQQRRIAEALVKLERPQRLDRLPIPGQLQEPVIENAVRQIAPEEFQPGGDALEGTALVVDKAEIAALLPGQEPGKGGGKYGDGGITESIGVPEQVLILVRVDDLQAAIQQGAEAIVPPDLQQLRREGGGVFLAQRRGSRTLSLKTLRACLKSSNKNGNEGKSKKLSRNKEFAFTIFPKPAEFVEPAKKTLYHPTARQHNKLV